MSVISFSDELMSRFRTMSPKDVYGYVRVAAVAVPTYYPEEYYQALDILIEAGIITHEQIALIENEISLGNDFEAPGLFITDN